MTGRIHSIETFATLDGYGIRFALFMQGCPLRCAYCHNPDTWQANGGTEMTVDEIVARVGRYKHYYARGGGVTLTGGEPLMQGGFAEELSARLKEKGYHIALDTAGGVIPDNIDRIISNIDLAIIDLKFPTDEEYGYYTKGKFDNFLRLMELCEKEGKEVWIRTVIVPDINDGEEKLKQYIDIVRRYKCVTSYKLLGYHTLGLFKYKDSGADYPLEGVLPMDKARLKELQDFVNTELDLK